MEWWQMIKSLLDIQKEINFNTLEKYAVFGHNRVYNYGKDTSLMANK